MPRHLPPAALAPALARGAALEHLLRAPQTDGHAGAAWLELRPSRDGIALWRFAAADPGHAGSWDLYAWLDAGSEDILLGVFAGAEEALAAALEAGATPDRWVNAGVLQDDYRDSIAGTPA